MSAELQVSELLELAMMFEARHHTCSSHELATEMGCSLDVAQRLAGVALKEGLIEQIGNTLRLTDKGRLEIKKHREHYVHERHAHRPGFLGRATRFLEGQIGDWQTHWRHRHGFGDSSLDDFYKGISGLQGRVEDVKSLADLRDNEKGVVAFALGGHRLITRLAEMGLTPGQVIVVVRSAPLNGPIEVSVRGVSLALGRGVASKIFVRECGKKPFDN